MRVKNIRFKAGYVKSLQDQLKSARGFAEEMRNERKVLWADLRNWKKSYDSLLESHNRLVAELRAERSKTLWSRIKEALWSW